MNRVRIVLVLIVALVGAAVVPAVHAQQAKDAPETKDAQAPKQPPDIRMLLTQPKSRLPAESAGVPDLRDAPMPKMDKPPVQPPITVVVGDPRCYPGEDGMGDSTRFNRRPRRSQ